MSDIQLINNEEFDGKHNFLAEELLIPNVNKTDGSRVNMFNSHISQAVVLKEPDFPKVFTNFENMVGQYSNAYKLADKDYKLIKIVKRHELMYTYLLEDPDGILDVLTINYHVRIIERFGYRVHDYIKGNFEEGDIIPEGTLLYRSDSYDEELNLQYGRNLKAVYLTQENMTYEDGIVVSESAAKKLGSFRVEKVEIDINTNDFPLNLYGTTEEYKAFPNIGERVKGKKVLALRRINHSSILFDATTKNMMTPKPDSDKILTTGNGIVANIEIPINAPLESLENKPYYEQIKKYVVNDKIYYQELIDVMDDYIDSWKYSDDVGFLYKRAQDILDSEVSWKSEKSAFDNMKIRFDIINDEPLVIGSKITNRYGGKGVITEIIPDDKMPVTETGIRSEILFNPLGVPNRLNPSQMYETELTYISQTMLNISKEELENGEIDEDVVIERILRYYEIVNTKQYEAMKKYIEHLKEEDSVTDFLYDVFENNLLIHQPPFFGNINFEKLSILYDEYGFGLSKVQGVTEKVAIGDHYFIVLEHHPMTKTSGRSTDFLNSKEIPSKSSGFSDGLQPLSTTPIKIGEMEVNNLLLASNVEELTRLLQNYSTNKEGRQNMIETLLTSKDPVNINRIESSTTSNKTELILKSYLMAIGLELDK